MSMFHTLAVGARMRTHRLMSLVLLGASGLVVSGCEVAPVEPPSVLPNVCGGCGDEGKGVDEAMEVGDGTNVGTPQGLIRDQVYQYHYSFDMGTRAARSRLSLAVMPPGGNCYQVSSIDGLSNVTWNGEPATRAVVQNGVLDVCGDSLFSGPLVIEAGLTIPEQTYNYTQVGFSRQLDRGGNSFAYLLSWVESCDYFGPCDDAPARLARFSFDVTHAPGEVVLCPGTRTNPTTTQTHCELSGTLAPTYSAFSIASNPAWVRNSFTRAAGVDLVFYEVPGGRLASSLVPSEVAHYMEWLGDLLGPFPYGDEVRVAGAPTNWLGAEHPANIILREDLPELRPEYANMTMHTLMHELAHQWAGNRTTLKGAMDFAWKEAIADYLAYVYEAEFRPSEAPKTLTYWDRLARSASYYPRPMDTPSPVFLSFAADVYGTGPMIFFLQLEPLIGGREKVLQAIQTFLFQPGYRSIDDLKNVLELVSGKDLDTYFNAWVYGSGDPDWPYFQVSTSAADGQVTVSATQVTVSGTVFPVAVELLVKGATQSKKVTVNFGLEPTSPTESVTVPFPEDVVSVVVDPDGKVVNRRFLGLVADEPEPHRWHL